MNIKENNHNRGTERILLPADGIELFDPRKTARRADLPSEFTFPYLTRIMNNIYWHSNHQESNDEGNVEFPPDRIPQAYDSRRLRRTREGGVNTYKSPDGKTYAANIVTGTHEDLVALDEQLYAIVDDGNFPLLQMHSHPEDYLGFHSIGDWTTLAYKREPTAECETGLLNASCVLGADAQVMAVMTKESHELIDDEGHDDFQQPWRDRFDEAQGDAGEEDQIRVELARYMGAWMYFSTDRANFKTMPPGQIVRRLRALEVARLRGRK